MEKLHHQEWAAKVKLLDAIAESQAACSRILHTIADVAGAQVSRELAVKLADNIERMTKYQQALYHAASGIRFKRRKMGTPAKPLNIAATAGLIEATRGVREDYANGRDINSQKKSQKKRQGRAQKRQPRA